MASILVIGSINVDLIVRVAKLLRPGETVVGGTFAQAFGGKGANQAVAAARSSGGPVAMLGAVGGDDFGRQSLAALQREGIDVARIRTVENASTGVAIIAVDQQGQNAIAVASGANALVTADEIERLPAAFWSDLKVVLVSLEIPLEAAVAALRQAKKFGVTTLLNPAPVTDPDGVRRMLPFADFVIPNETEAASLTGFSFSPERPWGGDDVEPVVRSLLAQGAQNAVVTLGSQGVAWQSGVSEANPPMSRLLPPPVQAIDATAAGDCFCGTLAAALAEGTPLAKAIRFSVAAAAISVTRLGAQPSLPARAEIEPLAAKPW